MKQTGYGGYYNQYWVSNEQWTPHRDMTGIEKKMFAKYFSDPGLRVLDFGCGAGYFCGDKLSKTVKEYAGLDISEQAVAEARGKGLNVTQFNIEEKQRIPYEDGHFDRAVCSEVLEHLFNPELVVKEIHRVLKPGGIFYTSVPNAVFVKERLRALFGGFNPKGDPRLVKTAPWLDPHIRFFTKNSFSRLLVNAGFKVAEIRGEEFTPLWELGLPDKLAYGGLSNFVHGLVGFMGDLMPSLFATKFVVIARKK